MILYLDTSSLARVYITEPGSDRVRALIDDAAVVVTSGIAYPELCAVLARRRRDRTLRPRDFTDAKRALDADWPRYVVVEVTPSICREAGELAERYGLRGYGSVHLASLADVVRGAGDVTVRFSSFDARLNEAASSLTRRLRAR